GRAERSQAPAPIYFLGNLTKGLVMMTLFSYLKKFPACVFICALASAGTTHAWEPEDDQKTFRILHIMSHHSPWRWTDGQLEGFKAGLGNVQAEYRVIQLDAKRNSNVEHLEQKGREARAMIDAWKPHLVYTSDDEAQQYVVKHYIDSDLPFVFSGVNKP